MVTNQIALMPAGAAMLVSTSIEDTIACPHCKEHLPLAQTPAEPGCLSVECPHCSGRSLLVRLVSILHRIVKLPGALISHEQSEDLPALTSGPPVRMPSELFSLPATKGALVLLALLWHWAERRGSTLIDSSISRLAQRLVTNRTMIRRWLTELEGLEAIREFDSGSQGRRRWELLPLDGKAGANG